jgi:hypothetical protein
LFGVLPVLGQVDAGLTGGVPLTPFILDGTGITSAPRRYTVGPTVELHLLGPVGIETGALYKRFGFHNLIGRYTTSIT